MKKMIKSSLKILLALFLLAASLVSFVGCDMIDEMRENHGYWNNDGSISLGEKKYMLLPTCPTLLPDMNGFGNPVYVTEKEVPVLLSDMFGIGMLVSKDRAFLSVHGAGETSYYCREDRYDELASRIEAGVALDNYCVEYSVYIESEEYYGPVSKKLLFNEKQRDAINDMLINIEPTKLPENSYLESIFSLCLYSCSEDMLFRSYNNIDLMQTDNGYQLGVFTDEGDIYLIYAPNQYKVLFDEIFSEVQQRNGIYYK